jgi:hypothetical protein
MGRLGCYDVQIGFWGYWFDLSAGKHLRNFVVAVSRPGSQLREKLGKVKPLQRKSQIPNFHPVNHQSIKRARVAKEVKGSFVFTAD